MNILEVPSLSFQSPGVTNVSFNPQLVVISRWSFVVCLAQAFLDIEEILLPKLSFELDLASPLIFCFSRQP
jgi:hypothetical protein